MHGLFNLLAFLVSRTNLRPLRLNYEPKRNTFFSGLVFSVNFVERPVNTSAKIGETLILRCTVEGEDEEFVQAHWLKDSVLLGFDDRNLEGYQRYTIIGDAGKGEYHLQIKPVSFFWLSLSFFRNRLGICFESCLTSLSSVSETRNDIFSAAFNPRKPILFS